MSILWVNYPAENGHTCSFTRLYFDGTTLIRERCSICGHENWHYYAGFDNLEIVEGESDERSDYGIS